MNNSTVIYTAPTSQKTQKVDEAAFYQLHRCLGIRLYDAVLGVVLPEKLPLGS